MNPRTVRDFSVPTDIWQAVTAWAETEGFRLVDDAGDKRSYQKGGGLATLATKLQIAQSGLDVHLEAWLHAPFLSRLFSLFTLPEEITLEPGGLKAIIPRTVSRDAINRLMIKLGQPMIG